MDGLRLVVVDRSEDRSTFMLLQRSLAEAAHHLPRYDIGAIQQCVKRTSADVVVVHVGDEESAELANVLAKLLDVAVLVVVPRHNSTLESKHVIAGVQDCLHASDFSNIRSVMDRFVYAIARASRRAEPFADVLKRIDKLSARTASHATI